MKRKPKRTHIRGALIFAALVATAGFSLVATGNFHNPLNFFVGEQHHLSGAPAPQMANHNMGQGPGFAHEGGPHAGNTSGIAWNQISAVFSDLWILFAIVACYILAQQTLKLITVERHSVRSCQRPVKE